jgi:ATP-dependent RNA helicase DDX42
MFSLGRLSCSAGDLVRSLAAAGQDIPQKLHELAERDPRFKKGTARGKGGRGGRGGQGRPGQVGAASCLTAAGPDGRNV